MINDQTFKDSLPKEPQSKSEQAIEAMLGGNENRVSERLRGIASDMRNIGASSMTPHELFAYWAREVDKAADLAAALSGRKLTAEQVEKIVDRNCKWYEGGEIDAQAIADELNAIVGGECEMELTDLRSGHAYIDV